MAAFVGAFALGTMATLHPVAAAPAPGVSPLTTTTSFYAPWNGNSNVLASGTGCVPGTSLSQPTMGGSSSGAVQASVNSINPYAGTGCSKAVDSINEWAGTHACYGSSCPTGSTYYSAPSTGFYTFTASWTFSFKVQITVGCPSAGGAWNLPDYAELNLTTITAIYNQSAPTGWGVPNSYEVAFHFDSRDFTCVGVGSVYTAGDTVSVTQTFSATTIVWLGKGSSYEPRSALEVTAFAVAVPSNISYIGFQTSSGSGTTLATLNSISVS